MGRAKILSSFSRNLEGSLTAVTVQYKIILGDEAQYLGEFKVATVKDGVLIVNYSATAEAKKFTRPPVVFERIEREISFE